MTSYSTLSVIICAYTFNRWNDICEAIESLRQQEHKAQEIILVCDNNPALEARARQEFPDITIIPNEGAPGVSGARNTGVAAASGSIVAFIDDDAVADRNWTKGLVEAFGDPDVVGVVGRVAPIWLGSRPSWFPEEYLWVVGCSYRGLPAGAGEVRNIPGGSGAIRRSVFETVGGFDHSLGRTSSRVPLSCEDTELCIRASQLIEGARFVFEPAALLHHKVPAHRLTWSYFTLRCYAEGVSKGQLVHLVGSRDGLSSERSYVLRSLSSGIAKGLGDVVRHADVSGVARSAAIIWGLACACSGYVRGRLSFSPGVQHIEPKTSGACARVSGLDMGNAL